MNIAFQDICSEHGIRTATEDHKHYREGWVQVECPFCTGNAGYHLGWSIFDEYFNCWRCGWHSMEEVVATLTGTDRASIQKVLREYRTRSKRTKAGQSTLSASAASLKLPICKELGMLHKKYLHSRGFLSGKLEALWNLRGTIGIGGYANRIIAPIYLHKRMVSFQGRDITGTHTLRYKACKKEKEVVHHKHTLYGIDHCEDSVVVVEGITDVWRLGYGSVCTFGIKFTPSQVRMLAERKRRYILFDTEDKQARTQGRNLAEQLSSFPGTTEYIELKGNLLWQDKRGGKDPGNLKQKEADAIMEELT